MANPASPPRRITRSSLARFAYGKGNATSSAAGAALTPSPDIEDAIPNTASRKRKRAPTTTVITKTKVTTTISTSASRKIKADKDEEEELVEGKAKTETKPPKRQRKPARKTIDPSTGTAAVAPPSDWEATYSAVRRMRAPGGASYPAAVDTMGCERLADRSASPRDQRLQTLVALMLSSQTKDTVNAVAMQNLKTSLPAHSPGAPPGLNLENLLAVSPEALNALIRPVGFHNNKTKYLKAAAAVLRDRWAGDIPDTIAGLVALPGVGPKMAHLCLSAAWGRTEGIGVDVHVHRITNLWRWHATRDPEGTRAALEAWLPRDRWREINGLLVGLGQTVCLSVGRRCGDCEVGLLGLCPAAERKKVLEGRKRREEVKKEKEEEEASTMAKIEVGEEGVEGEVQVKAEEVEEEHVIGEDVVLNGQQVKREEADGEDEKRA